MFLKKRKFSAWLYILFAFVILILFGNFAKSSGYQIRETRYQIYKIKGDSISQNGIVDAMDYIKKTQKREKGKSDPVLGIGKFNAMNNLSENQTSSEKEEAPNEDSSKNWWEKLLEFLNSLGFNKGKNEEKSKNSETNKEQKKEDYILIKANTISNPISEYKYSHSLSLKIERVKGTNFFGITSSSSFRNQKTEYEALVELKKNKVEEIYIVRKKE